MKKILMVLIVLLGIIIPNFKVEALEDSFYEGEYISGNYIKKFKGNSGKYQQMRVFRRKSDNSPVYCIELWEAIQSNVNITGYNYYQYNYDKLDYSTKQKIMLIAYYGYGYQSHTDIKWYAITQFMIWKEVSPDSTIYFTDKLNGNRIDKYLDEMNEINNLIDNHNKKPSFNYQTFEINYKENYTITDTNSVLDRFYINSTDGLKVSKNDNNLTVKANSFSDATVILVNKDNKYKSDPIVYVNPNGQDLLAAGSYLPIYMLVKYNIPKGDIVVNKKDFDTNSSSSQGDAKLEGSKFQLLDVDNKVIQEQVIDKDSNLIFKNIGYGSYSIKEVVPGKGYLLNKDVVKLEVNESVENVTFYNHVIKNKISFQKYIKNPLTGNVSKEKDAVFSIYNSNNEKVTTFTTNKEGKYELKLAYGNYIVRQESGAKNHLLIDDFKISVVDDNKNQSFDLYNEEIVAKIKIINTDLDSNLPILEKGSTFKIKDLKTDKYITNKDKENLILETDNSGITNYLTLSSGKYQIEQVEVVDGYIINENIFAFEIGDEVDFKLDENNNKYLEIIVPNSKQTSKIEIEKYIEYYLNDDLIKTEKDESIIIPIYAKEDIYTKDGLKIYNKDEQVSEAKFDNEKVITDSLVFGSYYLINPIDNTIIDIILNSIDNKKVELFEYKYEYTQEEPKIDNNSSDKVIIEVPNTLTKQNLFSNINVLFIILGFILIRGKKYENE